MAQTIKLKRSATQNAVPSTSSLALGELAINTYDGKLFIKKNVSGTESIVTIGEVGAGSIGPTELASTAVTAGSYGSTSAIPVITIDADGRITSASTATISGLSADSVTATEIAANAVGISELNVSDGTNGQVLSTNGSGTLSFVDQSGGSASATAFSTNIASGDGSTTAFTLSESPSAESKIIAFINGVFQNQDAYTISGTTLTFDTAPISGTNNVVVYVVGDVYSGESVLISNFSGNGTTTAFTLSNNPGNENNTQVYIDGVYQQKTTYSVSGTTLTFSSAPPTGTNNIEVVMLTSTTVNTPAAGSVVTASMADDSVTASKIVSSAVTTAKIADSNVTTAKIADDAVTIAKIADAALVIESEGIGSNDNDTTLPTSAAVKDYVDTQVAGKDALSELSGDTDDVTEGSTNLYYTDARVGTYISGNRTYGNITTTGYIAGPSTFTIDPAAVGDNTGTLVIAGNLQVDGTTTTINSTTVNVDDLNIQLATGAANAAAADGAGITVDGASATITYDGTNDEWDFNKDINVTGSVTSSSSVISSTLASPDGTGVIGLSNTGEATFYRGAVFNENSNDSDFRVESNNNTHMLFVDAGNDRVGIGTASPSDKLHILDGDLGIQNSSGKRYRLIAESNGGFTIRDQNAAAGRFHIDTSGKVGIGTTNPQKALDIVGASSSGGAVMRLSGTGEASQGDVTGAIQFHSADTTDNTPGVFGMLRGIAGASGGEGALQILTDMPSEGADASNITMHFSSSGKVGIGTSSPSDLLHLESTSGDVRQLLNAPTDSDAEIKFAENGTVKYTIGHDAGSDSFVIGTTNVDTEQRLVIDSSGNVGISTTAPHSKLHIAETASGAAGVDFPITLSSDRYQADYGLGIAFRPENQSTGYKVKTAILASGGGYGYNQADLHFCLNSNNNTSVEVGLSDAVMTLKKGGNIGIGDTSPQDYLEINGSGKGLGGLTISNDTHNHAALSFARSSTATARIFISEPGATHTSKFNFQTSNASGGGANLVTAMVIDENQNVGIGIGSPTEKLDVQGDIKVGTGFKIASNVSSGAIGFNRNPDDGAIYTSGLQRFQLNGPFSGNDFIQFQNYNTGGTFVGGYKLYNSSGTQHFYFESVDSATLTINADTDNSDEAGVPTLDFKMDGSVTRFKMGVASDNNPYISTESDIALPLIIKTGTSGQNRVYINDTGMTISDGTAGAPDHLLQIVHDGSPVDDRTFISIVNGTGSGDISTPESHIDFEFFDSNSNQFPQARITSGAGTHPGLDANTQNLEGEGYIALATSPGSGTSGEVDPTNRLVVDAHGRVLINQGSSNLTYGKLQVSAGGETAGHGGIVGFFDTDASVGSSNLIQVLSFSQDTDATGGVFSRFRDSNSILGQIEASNGTQVSYSVSSDERLKENIVDASSQLNTIKNIKVREFDWKANGYHEVGMVAQELHTVVPNAVTEGGDDVSEQPWGVDYSKLTPYLIKAIQEQQTIIDDLKSRLDEAGL